MATGRPTQRQASINILANVARLDASRANAPTSLPGDMLSDLTDAFNYYEKNQGMGVISIDHFKNILHNFGYHKSNKKDQDQDLTRAHPDFHRCSGVDFPFTKYVIAQKWNKNGGAQEEAVECFKLFNKRNHDTITAQEVKATLNEFLEFIVTE